MDQKDCVFSNVWAEEKADNSMQIAGINATNKKGAVILIYCILGMRILEIWRNCSMI